MKRQGTLRSSSSGRDAAAAALSADHQTSTVHHVANSVGCMAGVFQLISTKYRTRRKFLTFGRRQQEKQLTTTYSSPRQSKPNSPARKGRERFDDYNAKNAGLKEGSGEIWRLSCDVPRSPTITPDIRRSNSPENFRSRSPVPSVVARLMGLEDTPPSPPPPQRESAVDKKKRKLLGALEKCDEDLQALKRIIESVRSTDRSKTPPLVSVGKGGGMAAMKKCTDPMNGFNEEQPSPVSVLEDFCDSPPPSSTGGWNSSTKRTQNDTCRLGRVPLLQLQRKKPGEDNVETTSFCFYNNNNNSRLHVPRSLLHSKSDWTTTVSPPQSRGGTMDDVVDEVCKDVEMGQKREIERLGVVVDDFIYRDLIEEMTKDLMGQRCHVESCLPFDKCKRKLRF